MFGEICGKPIPPVLGAITSRCIGVATLCTALVLQWSNNKEINGGKAKVCVGINVAFCFVGNSLAEERCQRDRDGGVNPPFPLTSEKFGDNKNSIYL